MLEPFGAGTGVVRAGVALTAVPALAAGAGSNGVHADVDIATTISAVIALKARPDTANEVPQFPQNVRQHDSQRVVVRDSPA